jgi:Na+/H+ antiporter NhaD/arsenite permease-like protein
MHAAIVLAILILTYIGMAAGRIAWLQVDRTGIALLAVIVLLASGQMTLDDFGADIDMSSLVLLFAMMIISAQLAASGFIDLCARTITGSRRGMAVLLALTVAIGGGLAALLATDMLVIAMAPLLIAGAQNRGLDPRPFIIALAASTNAGSAATLVGSPHNILIGQLGRLGFWSFLAMNGVPALFSLAVIFTVVWLLWRERMTQTLLAVAPEPVSVTIHPLDRNQTIKGAVAVVALLVLFSTALPREIGALIIAALLLANRKITSRTMIAAVDWPLLLLVGCLFAVTGTLNGAGLSAWILETLSEQGLLPDNLLLLTPLTLVTSNAIGAVPASMLVLQLWPAAPQPVLYALALLFSLSGNLLLTGSITNVMIVEHAERLGARLGFLEYAKAGIPITLLSVAFAIVWLMLNGIPLLPHA